MSRGLAARIVTTGGRMSDISLSSISSMVFASFLRLCRQDAADTTKPPDGGLLTL